MELSARSFTNLTNTQTDAKLSNLSWTNELETGLDVLDGQHRRYVELLNDFIEKATKDDANSEQKNIQVTDALVFLRQYAKEHFDTEETIMKEADFPEYEAHLEEHLYFLRHVGALCEDLEINGFSPKLSREVSYYTIEWFINHILLLDMQLVNFLKARH